MTARIILALVMFVIAGGFLTWRAIGGSRGAHAAPRRYVLDLDDDMPTAVIPRVRTEHAPPWDGEHITEPTAIMAAPVPEPEPEAYWIAAGTVSDGQVRTVRVELLPPVEELLGYPTVDDWLESAYTRAMALQVRRLELTDGAP